MKGLANLGRSWVVYTLSDPRTPDDVRYIGVTHMKPERRLAYHIRGATEPFCRFRTHSSRWVESLLKQGLIPIMVAIDSGHGEGWEDEIRWIASYKENGFRLTNHSTGGHGPLGCVRSPETREKLAAANRGKTQSPELVEKRIAPIRGMRHTNASRANMAKGASNRQLSDDGHTKLVNARKNNPDWNLKIAASNLGLKRSEETKKKLRERQLPPHTDATKRKIQDAVGELWKNPEKRAARVEAMKAAWVARKAKKTSEVNHG